MKRFTLPALTLTTALLAACTDNSSTAVAPDQPLFGKAKPVTEENPKLIWDWKQTLSDGTTATLIRGDAHSGSPYITYDSDWHSSDATKPTFLGASSGQYQGRVCGGRATVFWSGTNYGGDATFDPDLEPEFNGTCGPRKINVALGGTTHPVGPHMNVLRIMSVGPVGTVRDQWMQITNLAIPGCDRLQYGTPTPETGDPVWATVAGRAGIKVMRLQGTPESSPRLDGDPTKYSRWEVESVYPHTAQCFVSQKGKMVENGTHTVPFRFVISELPSQG
jgi:hypothetical protein